MDDELLLPSDFAEAVDMDATSERLTELARYVVLQPLIAANPTAPAVILEQLGKSRDATIRRAVAQNPNTPVPLLCSLAGEFPQEFLSNPLIPFMNMVSPRFIYELSAFSWASLLRFDNIPSLWLQQIKIDRSYQYRWPEIWKLMQLHVTQTDSTLGSRQAEAGSALIYYRKKVRQSVTIDPVAEMEIFLLFCMLFPGTVPMLKEQWLNAAKTQPRLTAVALALCTTPGDKNVRALLTTENSFMLCQIARHSRTSTKILSRLTVHKRSEIRRAVASNPHTLSENIAVLLSDPDPTVRRIAVAHPSLLYADHEMMLQDEDASVRAALAIQSRLDHALLTQLVGDASAEVRAACARNLKLPAAMLTTLAHDPAAVVRASAAAHPRLPCETQSVLLTDPEEAVRASLSGNARLLEECAIQLVQDPSLKVRTYLAANPRLPTMLLDQLWQQEEQSIWSGLARQPHVSPEFLTRLAQRGDVHVRAIVAAHKRMPVDVLNDLMLADQRALWSGLVANPHVPLAILERALNTPYTELWPRIFNHPVMVRNQRRPLLALLASKIQQQLGVDQLPNWLRQVVFQYYRALPATILEPFASSPYWEERYLAASHPHISASLLNMLANDGICYVRARAKNSEEHRQHISLDRGNNQ